MGWIVPEQRLWVSIIRLLCGFQNMDGNRLNKIVFDFAMDAASKGCHNWCWRVKKKLCELGLLWILDYNISKIIAIPAVEGAFVNKVILDWKNSVNQENAKRGNGRNKLRTYKHIKQTFCMEP